MVAGSRGKSRSTRAGARQDGFHTFAERQGGSQRTLRSPFLRVRWAGAAGAATGASEHTPAVRPVITITHQRHQSNRAPHRDIAVDDVAVAGDDQETQAGTVNDG